MTTHSTVLHLLMPDLFLHHEFIRQDLRPQMLEKLLARAYHEPWPHQDRTSSLFALFGLPMMPQLPVAALTRLYEVGDSDAHIWLRADPVYLRADRDHVLLFDADSALSISQEEANALVNELNQFYAAEPYQFSAPTPTHWYLRLEQSPDVQFTSLLNTLGKDIHAAMPVGAEAMTWRALLNEVQMLMHQSPVNAEREARHELPINSLWFWGLGALPAAPAPRWQRIWSDNPLARGLARLTEVPWAALPPHAIECTSAMHTPGEYLASILPPAGDVVDWTAWLAHLEDHWFIPLFDALKKRQLDSLICYPGDGRAFCITHSRVRHWWRRRQSWRTYTYAKNHSTSADS